MSSNTCLSVIGVEEGDSIFFGNDIGLFITLRRLHTQAVLKSIGTAQETPRLSIWKIWCFQTRTLPLPISNNVWIFTLSEITCRQPPLLPLFPPTALENFSYLTSYGMSETAPSKQISLIFIRFTYGMFWIIVTDRNLKTHFLTLMLILDISDVNLRLYSWSNIKSGFNPLNPELNPICYLLALLAHHFLYVSRIRVKSLTLRLLMSYIYGAPILDVSRSHTTTQHSR